jgi:hypothetical protein
MGRVDREPLGFDWCRIQTPGNITNAFDHSPPLRQTQFHHSKIGSIVTLRRALAEGLQSGVVAQWYKQAPTVYLACEVKSAGMQQGWFSRSSEPHRAGLPLVGNPSRLLKNLVLELFS